MTGDDLLAAVLAAPADDGPRLVYADWLIEHGDPRGELVNLQIAATREPASADARSMAARARALIDAHPEWQLGYPRALTFERGFVSELPYCPDYAAMDRVLAREPIARLAIPHGYSTHYLDYDVLARWPGLARMRAVELSQDRGMLAYRWSTGSHAPAIVPLGRLLGALGPDTRELRLGGIELPPDALASVHAPLERLVLEYAGIGSSELERLASAALVPRLRTLGLSCNPLGEAGTRALAALELLRLEHLAIGSARLDGAAVAILCEAPVARGLRFLGLGAAEVPGTRPLETRTWSRKYLQHRGLPPNVPGPEGFEALAAAELPVLEELDLSKIELDDPDIARLVTAPWVPRLRRVNLAETRVPIGSLARFPAHLVT